MIVRNTANHHHDPSSQSSDSEVPEETPSTVTATSPVPPRPVGSTPAVHVIVFASTYANTAHGIPSRVTVLTSRPSLSKSPKYSPVKIRADARGSVQVNKG